MFSLVDGALEGGGTGNTLLGKLGTGEGSCCGKLLGSSKSTTFVTSLNVPRTWATANTCSHTLVEKLTHARSHLRDPPLPGVTTCIVLP